MTSDLFGTDKFEHMPLHFEGTTELMITGDGTACPKHRCDFTGDDQVLAGDALQILKTGVGQPTNPNCTPEPD